MYSPGFNIIALSALALGATAETIRIDAGKDGLMFSPNSVKAKVGDILEFHFFPVSHSVVMGDFNDPCQPAKSGGFFSGLMPISSGEGKEVFQVTVNSTDPIFFYCSQSMFSHCKSGMSGVVNPSSDQTIEAYQKASKSVSSVSSPDKVFGGKLVAASGDESTMSAPSPSATSGGGAGGGIYGGSGSGGSDTKGSTAGNVQASAVVVFTFALGMALLIAA